MDTHIFSTPYSADITALEIMGLVNPELAAKIKNVKDTNTKLREQIEALLIENERLKSENKRLSTENTELNDQCSVLFEELNNLKEDHEYLEQGVVLLNDIVTRIKKEE